ncbi:MAG TPA: hypothetical protein VG146_13105 [Verrucomicrobiae bacterium]|nr:hypothetical protein [Verrucomicrobiae bacterium]
MSASIASSLLFLLASSCGWCGELSLKYALPGTDHGAVHTSPAIRPSDGWVFFGTDDMSSPANSRVYAYDPGVGEEWEFTLPNGQPTFSSPALSADGATLSSIIHRRAL